MYCDLRSAISEGTTSIKHPTTLAALPSASEVTFPGLFAWSPISTSAMTAALHLDRGLWATWRGRRITPTPLPEAWFRRAPGAPLNYLVSDILVWIAARRGEPLDTATTWRLSLVTGFGSEVSDLNQVRKLAHLYARATGPVVGDVRFTPEGFRAYLSSLLSSKDF